MRLLQDTSTDTAVRSFLVQGDDERFTLRLHAEQCVIPAEWQHDIDGEAHAEWQDKPGLTNEDFGQLLINIGLELRRKGELTHLDGQKPTV